MTAPSALDSRLVGLERGPGEHELSFEIVPHLCRGDGALYGGTALAASLAAMELVTGWPCQPAADGCAVRGVLSRWVRLRGEVR